jgi:hypothetical protein
MTPALAMSRCSGPVHAAVKATTLEGSARSSARTRVGPSIAAAAWAPAVVSLTARVTSAPAPANARTVSTPIPDAPPVTIARIPVRSMPATT